MAGSRSTVKPETDGPGGRVTGRDWTFYYDGDCGFCTRVMRLMAAMDRGKRVQWVAYQAAEALPGELTVEDLRREAYMRKGDVLEGGYYAFRRLARLLPPLWPLLPLLWFPGVNKVGEAVYAWVARNRARFPGSVCSVE